MNFYFDTVYQVHQNSIFICKSLAANYMLIRIIRANYVGKIEL